MKQAEDGQQQRSEIVRIEQADAAQQQSALGCPAGRPRVQGYAPVGPNAERGKEGHQCEGARVDHVGDKEHGDAEQAAWRRGLALGESRSRPVR